MLTWGFYALVILIALVGSPVGTLLYFPVALTRHILFNCRNGRVWYRDMGDLIRSFIGCSFIFIWVLWLVLLGLLTITSGEHKSSERAFGWYGLYYGMNYIDRKAIHDAYVKRASKLQRRSSASKPL